MKNKLINGDCFKILPKIKKNSAQLIFTSVPDLNDLGMNNEEIIVYETFIDNALTQFARIIKDDGFIAMCQSDRKMDGQIYSKHSMLIGKMYDLKFILKDYKIIIKDVSSKDQYRFPYQHLCVFTRKGPITRNGEWLNNIFIYDMKKHKIGAFYTFPIDFVKLIISSLTVKNEIVIDPFAGSGVVPHIAKAMKRQYLGIEINKELYNDSIEKGLDEEESIYTN